MISTFTAATCSGLTETVDLAIEALEKENAKRLKGILPKVYGQQKLDRKSLGGLIDLIVTEKICPLQSNSKYSQDRTGQISCEECDYVEVVND